MVQIKWLIAAQIDLKDIYEYISVDSMRYAKYMVLKIQNKTEVLKKYPTIGKVVTEFDNDSIREIIEGNYRIIYKIVNPKRIDLLMIHHGARSLKKRVKQ